MSSRHFLFCIPVRFGVFIMSVSMLLAWGGLSGFVFWVLWSTRENKDVPGSSRIGWGISGGIYAVFALISLFGFIGACVRKRTFVNAYSGLMWLIWFINLIVTGGSIITIVLARTQHDKALKACKESTRLTEQMRETCQKLVMDSSKTSFMIGFIGVAVLQLAWHLYGCIIVGRYVRQLEEEGRYSGPQGGAAAPVNITLGAPQPSQNPYAYGDKSHA